MFSSWPALYCAAAAAAEANSAATQRASGRRNEIFQRDVMRLSDLRPPFYTTPLPTTGTNNDDVGDCRVAPRGTTLFTANSGAGVGAWK